MAGDSFRECSNLVAWTLSGMYPEDHHVLIDAANPARILTRAKAHELVAAFVGVFDNNSTVCLHLANDITYPVLVLGIWVNNCRWTGTNTTYTAAELEHHFRISNTKYVITAEDHYETVQKAVEASETNAEIIRFVDLLESASQAGADSMVSTPQNSFISTQPAPMDVTQDWLITNLQNTILSTHQPSETDSPTKTFSQLRSLRELLSDPADVDLTSVVQGIAPSSIAALMQTSGTTGLPKIAARTHGSLIVESQAIEDNDATKLYQVRRLFCTPIFHGFTFVPLTINALKFGGTNYIMKRYDDSFAQRIHDFEISETMGAPPMLRMLVKDPSKHVLLQSLRAISFGGAVLGPELRKMTLEMFTVQPRLVPVYGMTEGGWFTTLKHPEVDDTGSVGRPIPEYQVRVAAIDGFTNEDEERRLGEILVRGPQLMTSYMGNEKATTDAFDDGWLKTGDIGYVEDNRVYLVDRAKELLKVNGWQVAPAELEDVLMQSEHVQDVAVFGVGEEEDEHPMVCIVATSEAVSVEMVMAHLHSRLARYKTNRCDVRFVQAIPKSPAGKILKKIMKERLAAGTLA